jgi:hypothetical protein
VHKGSGVYAASCECTDGTGDGFIRQALVTVFGLALIAWMFFTMFSGLLTLFLWIGLPLNIISFCAIILVMIGLMYAPAFLHVEYLPPERRSGSGQYESKWSISTLVVWLLSVVSLGSIYIGIWNVLLAWSSDESYQAAFDENQNTPTAVQGPGVVPLWCEMPGLG